MLRMVDGDDRVQVKFECKEVDRPAKTAQMMSNYQLQLTASLNDTAESFFSVSSTLLVVRKCVF